MSTSVHLKQLDRMDGIDVWRVDGHRIRDQLDVEFTNGHHHFSRPYIPVGEIWVDREAPGENEWLFWARRLFLERHKMSTGVPYLTALLSATHFERLERRRERGINGRIAPREIPDLARKRLIARVGGRDVWLVDGRAVRDFAYIDFTLGGHGYRYRFIPKGEVWIDDAVRPAERAAILHHEAIEVSLMARGIRYVDAHAVASRAEARFRRAARQHAR
jgi:hypothetical protein